MFIAFEGPDNVGKSTSARELTFNHEAIYNATKDNYEGAKRELASETTLVQCWDRIDWFSHMVYRLALPDREWNDDRVRTVFAMPDTHLVVKVHKPELANFKADEVVDTPIGRVNPMYIYMAQSFLRLNEQRNFELFKTVSLIEVSNDVLGDRYSQRLVRFSSPVTPQHIAVGWGANNDDQLLGLLAYEDSQRF